MDSEKPGRDKNLTQVIVIYFRGLGVPISLSFWVSIVSNAAIAEATSVSFKQSIQVED